MATARKAEEVESVARRREKRERGGRWREANGTPHFSFTLL